MQTSVINSDLNKNNNQSSGAVAKNNNPTNFFQSSNYFGSTTATGGCIPVGSEILFGVEHCSVGSVQGVNIPITTESKTTTDV